MKNKIKIIFHIDMNAFFASVEEIINPFLKGKAFAVCSRASSKGVISTASYAARKYGIGSAMPKHEAMKRLPSIIFVDSHFDLYQEYSMRFMNLLKEYTSLYEQASVDEAYLDVTNLCETRSAIDIAKEIQNRLYNEIGLPSSIGIAPNLFLAKMGSDYKKPMGITIIRYRDVPNILWPLKVGDMYGVGKRTVPRLNKIGINTIGDLANYRESDKLIEVLGENHYNDIILRAHGKGSDVIDPSRHSGLLSVGNSRTFEKSDDEDELKSHLRNITNLVTERLKKYNYKGKTISIQIKYQDFTSITRSKTINKYIFEEEDIYLIASDLFEKNWNGNEVRLVGVSVSNIKDGIKKEQYDLFSLDKLEIEQKIIDVKKDLIKKFGKIIK